MRRSTHQPIVSRPAPPAVPGTIQDGPARRGCALAAGERDPVPGGPSALLRRVLVAVLGATLLVTGCSADDRPTPGQTSAAPTRPAGPLAGDADAQAVIDRFEQVRDAFADLRAVTVVSTLAGEDGTVAHGSADLVTGDYMATSPYGPGQEIEVRRVGDLTWVRAPRDYWIASGYTEESSTAAVGKWVLAQRGASAPIDRQYNPGAVFTWLRRADLADIVAAGPPASGEPDALSVTFELAAGELRADFTATGPPRLTAVAVTAGGSTNLTEVVDYPSVVVVPIPAGDDVLAADAATP